MVVGLGGCVAHLFLQVSEERHSLQYNSTQSSRAAPGYSKAVHVKPEVASHDNRNNVVIFLQISDVCAS